MNKTIEERAVRELKKQTMPITTKRDLLYGIVHEEIMQARIKIARLTNGNKQLGEAIDDVLSKLCMSAPQKAIDLFKTKKP